MLSMVREWNIQKHRSFGVNGVARNVSRQEDSSQKVTYLRKLSQNKARVREG